MGGGLSWLLTKLWHSNGVPTPPASSTGDEKGDAAPLGLFGHPIHLCLIPELEEGKSYQQACIFFGSLDFCECSVFSGDWRQHWACGTGAGWEMPNHDIPPQEAVGHNFLGIIPSPQADVSFFTCMVEQTTSTWLHLCFAACCLLVHSSDTPLAPASDVAGSPHCNSQSFSTGTSTTAWWQKLHLGTCDVLSSAEDQLSPSLGLP